MRVAVLDLDLGEAMGRIEQFGELAHQLDIDLHRAFPRENALLSSVMRLSQFVGAALLSEPRRRFKREQVGERAEPRDRAFRRLADHS